MFLLIFLILAQVEGHAGGASSKGALGACDRWYWSRETEVRAVVLVGHGLNLKPSCMGDLSKELARAGFDVLRVGFVGHCGIVGQDYLNIPPHLWEDDARRMYAAVKARAQGLKVPLYLVGYSFSALVFQSMAEEFSFDRKVFLAPALAPKLWFPLARWIANLFPRFYFESLVNSECGASPNSGSGAVLAVDQFYQKWAMGGGQGDSTPILTFAEPKDEVVSFEGLRNIATTRSNWTLEAITNRGHTQQDTYHHLIVNKGSLGNAEWERVVRKMMDFLRPSKGS